MLSLIDKPSIDFILDEFELSGIQDVLIVSSRRKKVLEDYLDREVELEEVFKKEGAQSKLDSIKPRKMNIAFVRQSQMLGTGHALLSVKPWLGDEPAVVAYPDDLHFGSPPLALQLIQDYNATGKNVMAVLENPPHLERYGVLKLRLGSRLVETIVEKPKPGTEPSNLASIGRYLYTPEFFHWLEEGWKLHKEGEYYHIYALQKMMDTGKVHALPIIGERWDTGEPAGYLEAILRYAMTRKDLSERLKEIVKDLGLFQNTTRKGFQK